VTLHAVIHGGHLPCPFIIQKTAEKDDVLNENESRIVRQVLMKNQLDSERIHADVVQNGTGQKAAIPGIRIGGKTGTAQNMITRLNVMFRIIARLHDIGFAPLITRICSGHFIDAPRLKYYGGDVAARFSLQSWGAYWVLPRPRVLHRSRFCRLPKPISRFLICRIFFSNRIPEIKDVNYVVQGEGLKFYPRQMMKMKLNLF
jgi:hypothetical protein